MNAKKAGADVLPFRPYVYNGGLVNIADVVCPPYDVISPRLQERLYARSEFNVVRLELGREFEGDGPENNRYSRAKDFFGSWIKGGILRREEKDSIYIYNQGFGINGVAYERTGFLALFGLPPSGKEGDSSIFGHEKTLSRPKEDRFRLMEACLANFSPVFSVFEDDGGVLEGILKNAPGSGLAQMVFDFNDDSGVRHSFFRISEPSLIREIQEKMAEKSAFIADGHHRFETALNFRDYIRQKGIRGVNADYCMMYFAPSSQGGLVILPTHRCVVKKDFDPDELVKVLRGDFIASPVSISSLAEEMKKASYGRGPSVCFGFAHKSGKAFVLSLKEESRAAAAPSGNPLGSLDVSILENLILKNALKISQGELDNQVFLKYEKDAERAVKGLTDGSVNAVFLMNPTKIEDVIRVASLNLRMPQKSTFFYPKIITGLAINSLKE